MRNPFIQHPVVCLVVFAAVAIPFVARLPEADVDSSTGVLLDGDQRNLTTYEKVRESFGDSVLVVVVAECEEVFSDEGMALVRELTERLSTLEGAEEVRSLVNAWRPVREGFSLSFMPFIPDRSLSDREWASVRKFTLDHPITRNILVSADGKRALAVAILDHALPDAASKERLRWEVQAALAPLRESGRRLRVLSFPLLELEMRETIRRDLLALAPAAGLLMVLILWIAFRSLKILAFIFANHLIALAVLPGLFEFVSAALARGEAWAGAPNLFPPAAGTVNLYSAMLFPLASAIHLAFMIHLFAAFQRALRRTGDAPEALRLANREVFRPSLAAGLTTALGLLSLMTCDVGLVREFGALGAAAIGAVFALTFGPGVSAIALMSWKEKIGPSRQEGPGPVNRSQNPSRREGPTSGARFVAVIHRRKWIVASAAATLALLSIPAILAIRTDIRAVEFLSPKSPSRVAIEMIDREGGGSQVVQLEVDSGGPGGIDSMPCVEYMERVRQYAESRPGVSGVYSYSMIFCLMNQVWEGERPGSYRLPDSPFMLRLFQSLVEAQGFPFLDYLRDASRRHAYIVIRTPDMPAASYLALLEDVMAFAKQHEPPGVTISAQRGLHTILEADRRIVRGQVWSLGVTLAAVFLALAVLWRSARLAALSILCNALPLALMFAAAGVFSIGLNSITMMIAGVVLGVAVDDSIHFLTRFRSAIDRGATVRDAVAEAFTAKVKPIVCTSAVLVSILCLFLLSSFPPVVSFGALSSFALLSAMISVLILLPALLFITSRSGQMALDNPSADT